MPGPSRLGEAERIPELFEELNSLFPDDGPSVS